ncbi:MAG: carboxymuconolactone decarboxylase family protein [Gammaproteobacteria bacterium]|nr:carboxymuconolactone decarboxylase family protein [Gammaproteobacteria bacterium]
MSTSFTDLTATLNRAILELRKAQPDAMAGFSAMAKAAMQPGELTEQTKELIAIAIGVAGHCDGCIGFHAKALVRLGVSRAALMETLAVAVYMGGGPSLMYAADAVQAFDEFSAARAG